MKRRIISLLLAAILVCTLIPTAFAAGIEATGAANTLYALGLFNGTGTDANGKPIYDLDRAPTREEAVTMLVRLLGKGDEAVNGTWETPFTDVADWAKPYVGYAYTNGLTSGTSATAFGGNETVTASQYLTFVLRALGYTSGTDFQWNKAWELSDKIGLTNGGYNAGTAELLRGDVAFISVSSMDVKQKGTEQTLAEKFIEEGVFSGESYKKATEPPVIIKEEPVPSPPPGVPVVSYAIDGVMLPYGGSNYRTEAGTYTVTPYLDGVPFSEYEAEVEIGSARLTKNDDGTFIVDFPAGGVMHIAIWYDKKEVKTVDENGKESISYSRRKHNLTFSPPIPDSGFIIDHNNLNVLPGVTFGDNWNRHYVMDVYHNGVRITDYDVDVVSGAPFTVSIQADGSLLATKTGNGRGSFIIKHQGESATFGVVFM